ncbi:MAG: hypothetical protein LBL00_09025, partial [Endomicrobium sp.]|nr:hypothetical protein [Endomicrobium sp.]
NLLLQLSLYYATCKGQTLKRVQGDRQGRCVVIPECLYRGSTFVVKQKYLSVKMDSPVLRPHGAGFKRITAFPKLSGMTNSIL